MLVTGNGGAMVLKILTTGDGGVGKTTLLHRYKEGVFQENTLMTLGVGFFVKDLQIEETTVMLQLWDFGGQSQFRFMLQRYALGARGAIIMFDLTRLITLENIEEWVSICRNDNPDLPLILVGTKADLEDQIMIDDDYALEMKDKYNLFDYIKASSKSGLNVPAIFELLATKILDDNKERTL